MAAQTRARARGSAGARRLPPVTVARFEAATELVSRLSAEQTDVFLSAAQRFRDQHRQGTHRPLTPAEAAQVAAGLAEVIGEPPTAEQAAEIQQSSLKAYDEPKTGEVLLAGGLATAPAFTRAVLRLVAVVELSETVFELAYDDGNLDEVLDEWVKAYGKVELPEMRARAQAALEHFSKAAGTDHPEAFGVLGRMVRHAVQNTLLEIGLSIDSPLSSLIDSAASTAGPGATSSTDSGSERPRS